jgi:hypothetical protein
MTIYAHHSSTTPPREARILVAADWSVDPYAVVAACRRRDALQPARYVIVVPAWLHGIDWAGDPRASRPCAQMQLDNLVRLFHRAGLEIESAQVGDPDPTSAIDDARSGGAFSGMLLCEPTRRLPSHPFDLVHRISRATALSVERVAVRTASRQRTSRWFGLRRGGHCAAGAG